MNKLIAIVGPSGVGKTSLLQALAAGGEFALGLEEHGERPFQLLFKQDKKYALANQMDYLLYRARQERRLRSETKPGLLDGGLDLDFHGFTRLFQARGWLTEAEFELCGEFYRFARSLLPVPDLVVALRAAPEVIRSRLAGRARINIAASEDSQLLEGFTEQWLAGLPENQILRLDVTREPPDYPKSCSVIRRRILQS